MGRGVETRCNIVKHSWPISNDDGVAVGVVVHLVVQSVHPLPPDAYPAIAQIAEAGEQLATALAEIYQAQESADALTELRAAAGLEG